MRVENYITRRSGLKLDCGSGFSLLELIMVISIAAILVAMAAPSMARFSDREKIASLSDEFRSTVALVRSIAIKSGVPVVLCASDNGTACGGQWSKGWYAFRDDDGDSTFDATEPVVLRNKSDSAATQLSVKAPTGADIGFISFNYRGSPGTTVSVSVSRGEQDYAMNITPFGKLRPDD